MASSPFAFITILTTDTVNKTTSDEIAIGATNPCTASQNTSSMVNHNLEQQAQAIFDRFYDSISGKICALSEVIDIRDGTHDSPKTTDDGYSLVTSKHLLPFGVDISSANIISKTDYDKINERSKVNTGDILISMIGTVGLISYVIDSRLIYFVLLKE